MIRVKNHADKWFKRIINLSCYLEIIYSDFTDPKEATAESREALIEKHKDDFGKKYIHFP